MKNVYNIVLIMILGYSAVQANALQEGKASAKLLKQVVVIKKSVLRSNVNLKKHLALL